MVDFFQNFGYACSNVCLPSANLKSIAATMLSTRYHKIVPRFVALSQRKPIAVLGTNLR